MKKRPKDSGIYLITNIFNGKIYVGSSSSSVTERLRNHKNELKNNKHHNIVLQRAYNKYGEKNFIFEILELYPSNLCVGMEQYWMNLLDSFNRERGYNLKSVAGSSFGYKYTEEQRNNISLGIAKAGGRKNFKNPNYGKITSSSTKEAMIDTFIKTGVVKPIYLLSREGLVLKEFKTRRQLADHIKCDVSLIGLAVRNKIKTCKGYKVCYVENYKSQDND